MTTHTCGLLTKHLFLQRAAVAAGAALMLDALTAGEALADTVRAVSPCKRQATRGLMPFPPSTAYRSMPPTAWR